jgi:hypothetical protein
LLRRQGLIAVAAATLAMLLTPRQASATEIRLSFGVLERLLAEQVFTEDGRKYVKGNKTAKCSFAYLEHPKIGGKDGRLSIKARFTGKSAVDLMGRCVGTGDAFNLTVTGIPYFLNGNLAFKDIGIETDRDGFYIRRVKLALRATLTKEFKYSIAADAKRLMEQQDPGEPYKRKLVRFDVSAIQVAGEELVLIVDFVLAVQ